MENRRQQAPPPARRDWAYFLDVDGTLIDIAEAPDAVRIDGRLLALLRGLYQLSGGALALVSGRRLENLKGLLGDFQPPLAGQHGLERRDAAGQVRTEAGSVAPLGLARSLQPVLGRHPGLFLEDKGLTVALHYRQAPPLASYAHRLMRELIRNSNGKYSLQSGKCVVEVRPAGSDKGAAISAFMAEAPFAGRKPVFLGDDRTDEHGFATVNRLGGLSIKIGHGPTAASYRLGTVAAARLWLAGALIPPAEEGEPRW